MKTLLIILVLFFAQGPLTVVKNNGDQLSLTNVSFLQSEGSGSSTSLNYSYRGETNNIAFKNIKRISFKETIKRKKGVTTYRVILVKADNSKLEVEVDLVRMEWTGKAGKKESMSFSSVDKISF